MSHQDVDLADRLHKQGYRMTPQRQLVLDAVCEIGDHARPEEVFERVRQKTPAVHRATIYRTLKLLCDLGLITDTATAEGHLVYEISGKHPHNHLVCRLCEVNIEFSDDLYRACIDNLERQHDFKIETRHITLLGLCSRCRDLG